ncbi:MAG: hypothetical protein CMP91_12455 [Gammaproteobacteria bacterium]|nr:hypothetical protein [Gammaproteobacteria bacterium]|tara:strand:- start:3502 stop:4674 length:1173 start_codon:yes stop_codon:yes gene_type:complete
MLSIKNILKRILRKPTRKYPVFSIKKVSPPDVSFIFNSTGANICVYIENWEFNTKDHCQLISSGNSKLVDYSVCPGCNITMHKITEVFGNDGSEGLKTGICPECQYIRHIDNFPDEWYSEHFRNKWLERDESRESNVEKKNEPAELINKYLKVQSPKVLDIGCGLGDRLKGFQDLGCEVWGCEPSERRGRIASEFLGVDIFCGDIEEYLEKADIKFDCIYLYCVLAFLSNPFDVLEKAIKLLSPDAVLYIKDGNYTQHNFFHNSHLGVMRSFFSEFTFEKFAIRNNLEIIYSNKVESEYLFRKNDRVPKAQIESHCKRENFLEKYFQEELSLKSITPGKLEGFEMHYGPFDRRVKYAVYVPEGNKNRSVTSSLPIKFIHINKNLPPILVK